MTDKQLRHLSKTQMLEILRSQEALISQLEAENAALRAAPGETLQSAGSLAEAAVRVSGILEAAQKAADSYLDAVRAQHAAAEKEAAAIRAKAEADAAAIRQTAEAAAEG